MIMLVERGAHVVAIAPQRSECIFLPLSGKGEGIRYQFERLIRCNLFGGVTEVDSTSKTMQICRRDFDVFQAPARERLRFVGFETPCNSFPSVERIFGLFVPSLPLIEHLLKLRRICHC